MDNRAVKFSKLVWKYRIIFIIGQLFVTYNDATDIYSMQNYCNDDLIIYGDQIILDFDDNVIYRRRRNSSCTTTITTCYNATLHNTYPRLMFYFEDFNLDCDDGYLELYNGKTWNNRVSGLEGAFCGSSKPQGVFTADTSYFRIKYISKKEQYITDLFTIIFTKYNNGPCESFAHKCENSRCINEDLVCNGYDSCGDGDGFNCYLSTWAITGIVVGCIVGLALFTSVVMCCIYIARFSGSTPGSVQNAGGPVVVSNAQNQNTYSQPIDGVNLGSTNSTSPSPYVAPIATGTPNAVSDQQRYIHPIHGVNQGSNYPSANQMNAPTESSSTGITHEY